MPALALWWSLSLDAKGTAMKLTIRSGVAIAVFSLAACSQSATENYAENADANAGYAVDENAATAGNAAGADTLGNQLDQLNQGDGTTNESNAD